MARLYEDFIDGTLTADPGAGGTTLQSAVFANLPVVSGDTLKLVIDPDRVGGAPEIVTVTAHTASATSCTVTRGVDGTTARAHDVGTRVVLALVASDIEAIQAGTGVDHGGLTGLADDDHTQYLTVARHDADDHSGLLDSISFGIPGTVSAVTGTQRWYPRFDIDVQDVAISLSAGTATVDVNRNGTSIFTTQGNRPAIASGNFDVSGTPDGTTALTADTDYLTIDVDAASGAANLTVTISFLRV